MRGDQVVVHFLAIQDRDQENPLDQIPPCDRGLDSKIFVVVSRDGSCPELPRGYSIRQMFHIPLRNKQPVETVMLAIAHHSEATYVFYCFGVIFSELMFFPL